MDQQEQEQLINSLRGAYVGNRQKDGAKQTKFGQVQAGGLIPTKSARYKSDDYYY